MWETLELNISGEWVVGDTIACFSVCIGQIVVGADRRDYYDMHSHSLTFLLFYSFTFLLLSVSYAAAETIFVYKINTL